MQICTLNSIWNINIGWSLIFLFQTTNHALFNWDKCEHFSMLDVSILLENKPTKYSAMERNFVWMPNQLKWI